MKQSTVVCLSKFLIAAFAVICLFVILLDHVHVEATVNHDIKNQDITFVDDSTDLSVKVSENSDEDYYPSSRGWNGIPSVIAAGENIFVAWYTGGTQEPHPDNYVVVAASDDRGKSWIDPFIIIDPIDTAQKTVLPIFYYNADGVLWLTYSDTSIGLVGVPLLNAAGPLSQVTCGEKTVVATSGIYMKPLVRADGSIFFSGNNPFDKTKTYVFRSTDGGKSSVLFGEMESLADSNTKICSESQIVEKRDGSLWMLCRIEDSPGIESSYSYDGGKTWTTATSELPYPLRTPGSRFTFMRLQSGALLFITNDDAGQRVKLKAYLSDDDGETWPYSIMIDSQISSYPEAYQAEDGQIYIAYDKGRYMENGIRLTILQEEDIRAGEFISDSVVNKCVVTKLDHSYADLISVNGAFPKEMAFPLGTAATEIVALLPNTFSVTDTNGKTIEISGVWRCPGFNPDQPGEYVFAFQTSLPVTMPDSFDILYCTVSIGTQPQSGGGCGASIFQSAQIVAIPLICLTAIILVRRKKRC